MLVTWLKVGDLRCSNSSLEFIRIHIWLIPRLEWSVSEYFWRPWLVCVSSFVRVSEWVNWLSNVTINDISVIYVTAHRCAGGLKKKLDLRSGSHAIEIFVGFFNVPVLAPTRAVLWEEWIEALWNTWMNRQWICVYMDFLFIFWIQYMYGESTSSSFVSIPNDMRTDLWLSSTYDAEKSVRLYVGFQGSELSPKSSAKMLT